MGPFFFSLLLFVLGLSAAAPAWTQFARTGYETVQAGTLDQTDLRDIEQRFAQAGLTSARVRIAPDQRVELVGEYQNRRDVQIAFSIAQSVVGVRRVAPTTPENVRYPVEELADKISDVLNGIPRSGAAKPPADAVPNDSQKYALVVGIGDFEDKRIRRLKYSAKDARDFHDYLISSEGGGFPRKNVRLLTDSGATRATIEQSLDHIARVARPGDVVVLYISSHGAPLNDRGNMNIVVHDTRPTPREDIFLTSLTDDKLTRFIQSLPKSQVFVLLDTCYSGGAFAKVPEFLASGAKDLFVEEDRTTVQGIPAANLKYLVSGGKDLVVESSPAPTPNTVSPGKILMSASDGTERSWESEQLKNSFFTYYIIQGMQLKKNVRDAFDYAKPVVSNEVRRSKAARQTPQAVFAPNGTNINMTSANSYGERP